jgi:hypothetical protein
MDGSLVLTREKRNLGDKPVPVTLGPPQISHGLTWDRTRNYVMSRAVASTDRHFLPWNLPHPAQPLSDSAHTSRVLCSKSIHCSFIGSSIVLQRAPVVNSTVFRQVGFVLHQDHGQRVVMLGTNRAVLYPHQHVSKPL